MFNYAAQLKHRIACNEAETCTDKNETTRKWKRNRVEKGGGQDEYGILNVGKEDKRMGTKGRQEY